MINKKVILVFFVLSVFASCKKTYQCQCTNSSGTYAAGETEGTKMQAKKHCESLSEGSTTCGLQ